MQQTSIAEAILALDELLQALNDAYWEVNNINQKDALFDIVTTLHEETNELAKLSIEDHSMPYEPITAKFRSSCKKMSVVQKNIESWFIRTTTSERVSVALPKAAALISDECLIV